MRQVLRTPLMSTLHSTRSKNPVGFIGLGQMGAGMIQRVATERQVYAFDANPKFMDNIPNKSNIQPVKSLAELADKVDTFITMVPNHTNVQDICYGNKGLFALASKNSLFLDCSTISPFMAVEIAQQAQSQNQVFVDCPVSGGIMAAAAGTLAFMVGAPTNEIFEKAEPVLKPMSKAIINCGKPGGGQIAKICNNMALGIEMIAVSEALSLGNKLGLDPKLLSQIMKVSSSNCWSVDIYNPAPGVNPNVPAGNDYNGGFACELILKDLSLAMEASQKCNSQTPLGKRTQEIYDQFIKQGLNRKDFSIVYKQLMENKI